MDTVEEVKQKISIVDLISGYVPLKKAGRNYKALCPFHSEKTPSFMVSPELQIYKCFGCSKAGDIFSFIQEIEGLDFPAALEQLAEKAGVKIVKRAADPERSKKSKVYEINHLASEFYHFVLTQHRIGKNALKYLKSERKLKDETIKEFKLGYAPDFWSNLFDYLSSKKYEIADMLSAGVIIPKKSETGYIDKFKGRIIFPLTGVGGNILGFMGRTLFDQTPKYLNTSETLVFHKGSFLYGLDSARMNIKKKGAIFVEGPMDVLSAFQAGQNNVVATSGTSLTVGQLKILSRYTKDIIFCFDSDSAGVSAIHRAIELAEKEDFNMKVALVPEKFADLDEFIREKSKNFKEIFDNAIPIFDFFLVSALKKHDKKDSIGKKKIMEELAPLYSKIRSPVTLDHYVKTVSEELDLSEEVIKNLISKGGVGAEEYEKGVGEETSSGALLPRVSPQKYMLILLLRAPLDIAQTLLYKLGQKDFTDPDLLEIFAVLKNYLSGRKRKFDIKYFNNRFEGNLRELVTEMYLWDLGRIVNNEDLIERELEKTFDRVKRNTTKRELKELSGKIKQAELEKSTKQLKELMTEFKELSEKLR